ncbi:MAG: nucleotidyltransferase domain-containing protein, partial [Treponema sp.]|nr:nucleotidyltransferase domain-containing protein [Treponema sp.]MBP3773242.1 nucleotidyltransferase domain-containing protein [Treponema sp.]
MKFGLSDNSLEIIGSIFEKYPSVSRAVIYGSRAKGNFRPGSDIDITLETTTDFT